MEANQFLRDFSLTLQNVLDSEMESTSLPESRIAERIGISKGALSHYKTGKRMPSIYALILIAQYFKVSPNIFLGYDDDLETDRKTVAQLYTGLSMKATEALHHNLLYSVVFSFLLEDEGRLRDLVGYFLSSLYDDLAQDERYNCLPGIYGITETAERKKCFNGIIDEFADYRGEFYQWVTSKSKRKNEIIREVAYNIAIQGKMAQIRWPRATDTMMGIPAIETSDNTSKLNNFTSIKDWDAKEERCLKDEERMNDEWDRFFEMHPEAYDDRYEIPVEEQEALIREEELERAKDAGFSTIEEHNAFQGKQRKQTEAFFIEYEKRIQRQRKSEDDIKL